jgi:hypothetical protein
MARASEMFFPRGTFSGQETIHNEMWMTIIGLMDEGDCYWLEEDAIGALFKYETACVKLKTGICAHYDGYVFLVVQLLDRLIRVYEKLGDCVNVMWETMDVLRSFKLANPHT